MFGIGKAFKGLSDKTGGLIKSPFTSLSGSLFGSQYGFTGPLGKLYDVMAHPSTQGLSRAERMALEAAKADEADRRQRLLEMQRRRSRVALGVQGGQRALLYSGFTGVT